MFRFLAILFGIGFIFIGVAGFMPAFMKNGALAGVFLVNDMHNVVHIILGVLAIMAATNFPSTKLFFLVAGIVLVITALIGFIRGSLFFMQLNTPDNFLYLGIGALFLFFAWYANRKVMTSP